MANNRIVVTLDERDPIGTACACGRPTDVLITTTVYRNGAEMKYAGSIQSGCADYANLVYETALHGAALGGYTVELEDNVGVPSTRDPRDNDEPFDGPAKPEHDE